MQRTNSNNIYYSLIAAWVLCEAMLGGVIHGFKLPISGLVVGSGAIVCIALIGYYVPAKGAIIKATFIVAIFKVMLSPQAPPQAYIAVFFQGVLGELLFMKRSWFKFSCMLLAILAMLESALQRIIVLTVLYGTSFWKGVDQFISNLVGQKSITRYSILVAGAYVLLHLLAGILLGWFTAMLPSRVRTSKNDEQFLMKGDNTTEDLLPSNKKRKTSIKTGLLIVWLILIALYIRSVMPFGKTLPPAQLPLHAFIRSILMVFGWYLIVAPLLMRLLQHTLKKKQAKWKEEIQRILEILPHVRSIIVFSWSSSSKMKGLRRINLFCKTALINILYE